MTKPTCPDMCSPAQLLPISLVRTKAMEKLNAGAGSFGTRVTG